jgi:hypothetical protein
VASDERAGEVAQTRMESTESQPDDDDDMSATSAAFENNSNNIDEQERQELFHEGVPRAPSTSVPAVARARTRHARLGSNVDAPQPPNGARTELSAWSLLPTPTAQYVL